MEQDRSHGNRRRAEASGFQPFLHQASRAHEDSQARQLPIRSSHRQTVGADGAWSLRPYGSPSARRGSCCSADEREERDPTALSLSPVIVLAKALLQRAYCFKLCTAAPDV